MAAESPGGLRAPTVPSPRYTTERRNVGDQGGCPTRHGLEHRVTATFAVAATDQEVCRPTEELHALVGHPSQEMDTIWEDVAGPDTISDRREQPCGSVTTPELRVDEVGCSRLQRGQNRERVFVPSRCPIQSRHGSPANPVALRAWS